MEKETLEELAKCFAAEFGDKDWHLEGSKYPVYIPKAHVYAGSDCLDALYFEHHKLCISALG